jgi:hypothetical protein
MGVTENLRVVDSTDEQINMAIKFAVPNLSSWDEVDQGAVDAKNADPLARICIGVVTKPRSPS